MNEDEEDHNVGGPSNEQAEGQRAAFVLDAGGRNDGQEPGYFELGKRRRQEVDLSKVDGTESTRLRGLLTGPTTFRFGGTPDNAERCAGSGKLAYALKLQAFCQRLPGPAQSHMHGCG